MIARAAFFISSIQIQHPRQRAVLLMLVAGVLMMPVSYRAGADVAHPHTVFQGVIDAIRGEPHHHGQATAPVAPSPFSPPAVPLHSNPAPLTNTSALHDVDVPSQLQAATPMLAETSLLTLGLLIAVLLLAWRHRWHVWAAVGHLEPVVMDLESPPPRASCT